MGQDTSQNKDRIREYLRQRGEATNAGTGTDQPGAKAPASPYKAAVKGLDSGVKAPKKPGTPGGETPQSLDEIQKRIDRILGK